MAASPINAEFLVRARFCHVLVCCAASNEYGAASQYLWSQRNVTRLHPSAGAASHSLFRLESNLRQGQDERKGDLPQTRQYEIALAVVGQGPETAAIQTQRLLALLQPQAAMMVGVCGSDVKEYCDPTKNIHRVLFCHTAYNYQRGKYKMVLGGDKHEIEFLPEYHEQKASLGVTAMASLLPIFQDTDVHVHNEPVVFATGSAVRADGTSLLAVARSHFNRQISAVDMEASAFIESCIHAGTPCLGVVKTASDAMDANKSMSDNEYAAFTSRAVDYGVLRYARKYLDALTSPFEPLPFVPSGATLAMGYCTGFLIKIRKALIESNLSSDGAEKLLLVIPEVDRLVQLRHESWQSKILEWKKHGLTEHVFPTSGRGYGLYVTPKGNLVDGPTALEHLNGIPFRNARLQELEAFKVYVETWCLEEEYGQVEQVAMADFSKRLAAKEI